jgi:hypothetical protein
VSEAVQPGQGTASVLRLHWPFGRTVLLGLLSAAALAGIAEVAARTDALHRRLPPETVGGGLVQLDRKLVLTREMIGEAGPIDCLFLGSSQVYRSIDPEIVDRALRQAAGQGFRSFNFGLGGMSETSEAEIAKILLGRLHPKLVVIGASSYGLYERKDRDQFESHLATSPWFRFHQGDFTVEGWLSDRSVAFRQFLGYRFWREQSPETRGKLRQAVKGMTASGYGRTEPGEFRGIDRGAARDLRRFEVSPDRLSALADLLRQRAPGLEMLVVEVPVSDTALQHFGDGEADHQRALDEIEKVTARYGVPFWRYPAERAIPVEGWADFIHLNQAGAETYSRWLGDQLLLAVRDGRLKLPSD